ncbi:accessory gene regulator B family protein [Carnobacterium divergens]|nr:accessory gene regulator B family protein [Carnobacterium divergens]MDO0874276.1 accessory gene regulator B family protein [Carnobacterium divergens]MDT2011425.1 accessory gene regulator B family protein [Carnobacterium divergens]SUX21243.1 Accessory gene regulator protein B [Carnobacterium divergens]
MTIPKFSEFLLNKMGITSSEKNYDYIQYGLEILLINLSKLTIIYGIAYLTKQLIPTLIVHLSYMLLRRYSFGLHSLSSFVCTITSIALFNIIPYFFKELILPTPLIFLISFFIFFSILLYSPADTENNPLVDGEKRKKLRIKSTICCIILLIMVAFVPATIKTLILLGGFYQALLILPVTYKILKRRYNNYELYE